MSKPKIIGGATSRTMRAHWAAHELGIDYDAELIGSRTGATQQPEFLALNRKEKIPVLLHNDMVLTESGAIVNYLGRIGGGLLPESNADWARYEEWQSHILMEIDSQCLYIMRKHRDLPQFYGEAPVAVETAIAGYKKQIQIEEQALEQQEYLLGDRFTGVDILLVTCLTWAKAYGFELSDVLTRYLSNITQRDAYKQAGKLNFSISPGA